MGDSRVRRRVRHAHRRRDPIAASALELRQDDRRHDGVHRLRRGWGGWGCPGGGGVPFAWGLRPAIVPPPPLAFTILAPLAAAIAAGFVETIPVRLDDNISVPATAAMVLWLASLIDGAAWQASRHAVVGAVPWGVLVNAATAWLGYRAKTVSRSGALAGFCVGLLIYVGGGAGAWLLLFATFLA